MSNSEHYTEVSKFSNDFYDNIYTNFTLNRQVTFNKLRFFDRIIYFCNMQSILYVNQNFTMDIGTRDFYNQYTNLQQFQNYKLKVHDRIAYLIDWFCNNYEIFKVIASIFNDNYTFISTNEHKILLNTHPLFGIATYVYTLNNTLYKIYDIWKLDYEYYITNNNDNLKIIHKIDFLKFKFNITNTYLLHTDFLYNINKEQLLKNNLQQFYEGGEDNYKYFFELYNYLMEYINSIVKKESCKKIIQILEKINHKEYCKKIIKILREKYICKKELLKKESPKKSTLPKKDTPIKEKYKKKPIPPPLKRNVWHKYIGEDIGKAKCLCCKLADITQMSFHCGHIIAESKGGELSVNNLKPICQSCNSSMGTQNMDEYIEKYGF
jgi:5-methylcytosine-specific restriction endonuclease McrA